MVEAIKAKVSLKDTFEALGIVVKGRKAVCPLHNDTHPSLSFNDEGLWYCFVCGVGGDMFNLVMSVNKIGFKDAISWFNEHFNLGLTSNTYRPDPYIEALNENYESLKKSLLKEIDVLRKKFYKLNEKSEATWKAKDFTFDMTYLEQMDVLEHKLKALDDARYRLRNRAVTAR